MSIQNTTLAHFRHFSHFSSLYYNIFPDTLNYAKQTQSQVRQNQRNLIFVKDIRTCRTIGYSDKQTQNKPNLSQNKANSNPIASKGKYDANSLYTKDYDNICKYGPKNTNPKQTQLLQRPKMLEFTLDVSSLAFLSGAFAWIRSFTIILIMLLADFTTLRVTISFFSCRKTPQSSTIYREHGNLIIF
jgi:hypothetical protein